MKTDNPKTCYPTYRSLPPLAGLAQMTRAVQADWSLEQSVARLKRLHFSLRRIHEILTERITNEPIYELKTAFSYHSYLCAEQVDLVRRRVSEMREPPLGLDKSPNESLEILFDEISGTDQTMEFLIGIYEVALPAVLRACNRLKEDAHPLADAPTVRVAKLVDFEIYDLEGDPAETKNLVGDNSAITEQLCRTLEQAYRELIQDSHVWVPADKQ